MSHFGKGFYLDLHGQSHPEDWMEFGYLLPRNVLNLSDSVLDESASAYASQSSIHTLASRLSLPFSALLRGEHSLGGLMENAGYKSVPSPKNPHPQRAQYFDGGPCTKKFGSAQGGTIDGVQLEMTKSARATPETRRKFAKALASVLNQWLTLYF
eukprot:TRINITY_DN9034_c0_g1_i1.p1 TRINITY_DN9034_c0_g1~~TRINITY_DN9034_c0_g1_i1.p1  ORF type:complete len:155 (+),score=27.68 TRINITY_DN9034_c0_g1_i1:373-837(+)